MELAGTRRWIPSTVCENLQALWALGNTSCTIAKRGKKNRLTLASLLIGCRGSKGRSLLPGMMKSGGVQSTESDCLAFLSRMLGSQI
jgi:hypothetical protein